MKLLINQKEKEFANSPSLQDIVKQLELPHENGVALAVNQNVIHKEQWPSFKPSEGDSILLMQPVQGG